MEPFLALVVAAIVIIFLSSKAKTLKKKQLFPGVAMALSVGLYLIGYMIDGWAGLGYAVAGGILFVAALIAAFVIVVWWIIRKEYGK